MVGGFPIAIIDGSDYEDGLVQLQPGDRVCLLSDGILEQTGPPDDEQFGEARLLQSLRSRQAAPAEEVVEAVVKDLEQFAGSKSFVDDLSVLIAEWTG